MKTVRKARPSLASMTNWESDELIEGSVWNSREGSWDGGVRSDAFAVIGDPFGPAYQDAWSAIWGKRADSHPKTLSHAVVTISTLSTGQQADSLSSIQARLEVLERQLLDLVKSTSARAALKPDPQIESQLDRLREIVPVIQDAYERVFGCLTEPIVVATTDSDDRPLTIRLMNKVCSRPEQGVENVGEKRKIFYEELFSRVERELLDLIEFEFRD